MSVIGRLDKQVDAILISPLARRNRTETPEPDSEAAQAAPPAEAPINTPEQPENSRNRTEKQEELPVWLL